MSEAELKRTCNILLIRVAVRQHIKILNTLKRCPEQETFWLSTCNFRTYK